MFDDTVTVFNHYKDSKQDKWNKTILENCMWKDETIKTVSNNQIQVANCVSLTVLNREGYLPPDTYAKSDDKENYFTFNASNNLDIVVLGEVEEDLDELYTLNDLKKKYSSVATISAVSDNTRFGNLKNWKVTAK